jgi:hypothetical protein
MIISIQQNSIALMIKTLNKPRTERNVPNVIKDIYEKSIANNIFNGERLKYFPPKY